MEWSAKHHAHETTWLWFWVLSRGFCTRGLIKKHATGYISNQKRSTTPRFDHQSLNRVCNPRAHETSKLIYERVGLVGDHHRTHAALSQIKRSVARGGLGRGITGCGHRARTPSTAAVLFGGFSCASTRGRPGSVQRVVRKRVARLPKIRIQAPDSRYLFGLDHPVPCGCMVLCLCFGAQATISWSQNPTFDRTCSCKFKLFSLELSNRLCRFGGQLSHSSTMAEQLPSCHGAFRLKRWFQTLTEFTQALTIWHHWHVDFTVARS